DGDGRESPALRGWVTSARFRIFDRRDFHPRSDASLTLIRVPELAGAWVFHTLVPPEKLEVIEREWLAAWRRERPEILRRFTPLGRRLVSIAVDAARRDTQPFLVRHRPRIERFLQRIEGSLGDEELRTLFEDVVWPTLRRHFEPIVDELGREIWDRLPIWSFSWRFAWQSLPLTSDDLMEERWREFVGDEIAPLVRARMGDLIATSKLAARDIFASPKVAAALRELGVTVMTDPEFHDIIDLYVREVLLENAALREEVQTFLRSKPVQIELAWAASRLETVVRRIGDLLLGTRATGISPEFATVLRAQILLKGKHRLCVDPGSANAPALADGAALDAMIVDDDPRAAGTCGGRP
ncbi:MAG TPA: hypothetical protein VK116_12360, partial [Planctomycetota bacterium]|nr:hypothetical protein [Planctomycetota bacterium]